MKGAKKDKKNGKDSGGGVVAAVTKHAAGKFKLVLPRPPAGPSLERALGNLSLCILANVSQVVTVPTRNLLQTPPHPQSSPQT
jgi:hypothetical protein